MKCQQNRIELLTRPGDKQTLRSAIDDGWFDNRDRIFRMFREMVDGIHHIHAAGMIHRDLKPVNIFLDNQNHVKIGDFGLATTGVGTNRFYGHSLNCLLFL